MSWPEASALPEVDAPGQLWWRAPFVMRPPGDLEVGDGYLFNTTALATHVRGPQSAALHPLSSAGDGRRMSLRRALAALRRRPTAPAHVLVTLRLRHYRLLLRAARLSEPSVLEASRLPERECEGALVPANASSDFERSLRWRMLALGGAAGAGMPLHVDEPPTANWHLQLRGRKRWLLCPPAERPGACSETTLHPGASLFYPEGWWHQTRTLDAGAASVSRSVVTPGSAAPFAGGARRWCAAARLLDSHARLCEALAPCLRRLAAVRV